MLGFTTGRIGLLVRFRVTERMTRRRQRLSNTIENRPFEFGLLLLPGFARRHLRRFHLQEVCNVRLELMLSPPQMRCQTRLGLRSWVFGLESGLGNRCATVPQMLLLKLEF